MAIMYVLRCDHPDCPAEAPEATTELAARVAAIEATWQRWRTPGGEVLDLCPTHRNPVRSRLTLVAGPT